MTIRQKTAWLGNLLFTIGWVYYLINLPFQWVYLPTALGMMIAGLGWLILIATSKGKIQFTASHSSTFRLLFFFYFLGLALHMANIVPKVSAKVIGIQTPLWVWSLMFGLQRGESSYFNFKHIKIFFFISATASAVFTIARFCYHQWIMDQSLGYRELSPFEYIPVHYLAMLFAFAFLWSLHIFLKNQQTLFAVITMVFLFAVLILNVRIQWAVIAFGLLALAAHHKWYLKKSVKYLLPLFLILIGLTSVMPESKRRFQETKDELLTVLGKNTGKQTNARVYLWKFAWEVIKSKPLFGYKPGHADIALQAAYEPCEAAFWDGEGVYYLRDRTYNYHNTYLQAWADRGVFGFLILLISIAIPLAFGKSIELKLLALVFGLSFLTESMLDRQAGVFFFSFLMPLFSLYKIRNPADQ